MSAEIAADGPIVLCSIAPGCQLLDEAAVLCCVLCAVLQLLVLTRTVTSQWRTWSRRQQRMTMMMLQARMARTAAQLRQAASASVQAAR